MPRIRLVVPHDGDALAELQQRNREYLAPWEPIRGEDYFSAAGQRADIGVVLARHARGKTVPFVILDDDGSVAGRLTLSGIVRGAFQSCSMGYWLSEDRTGRGLATEAVSSAVAHAFRDLGLHRVQAETLPANGASQRVLTRAGFERYGLARGYLKIAGRWQDHVMFQRLNEDA
ncbi:GNAT family N-acetyltransferase [Planctomonas deserti]|uniref:GNAT family N-acetyltransferase n=1 Tax=Planctomonas deserti TaxID=2144185 RepID=UPI000D378D85|nr:GNAT family N-acetyltransferase [Planctomonas deserti]